MVRIITVVEEVVLLLQVAPREGGSFPFVRGQGECRYTTRGCESQPIGFSILEFDLFLEVGILVD